MLVCTEEVQISFKRPVEQLRRQLSLHSDRATRGWEKHTPNFDVSMYTHLILIRVRVNVAPIRQALPKKRKPFDVIWVKTTKLAVCCLRVFAMGSQPFSLLNSGSNLVVIPHN